MNNFKQKRTLLFFVFSLLVNVAACSDTDSGRIYPNDKDSMVKFTQLYGRLHKEKKYGILDAKPFSQEFFRRLHGEINSVDGLYVPSNGELDIMELTSEDDKERARVYRLINDRIFDVNSNNFNYNFRFSKELMEKTAPFSKLERYNYRGPSINGFRLGGHIKEYFRGDGKQGEWEAFPRHSGGAVLSYKLGSAEYIFKGNINTARVERIRSTFSNGDTFISKELLDIARGLDGWVVNKDSLIRAEQLKLKKHFARYVGFHEKNDFGFVIPPNQCQLVLAINKQQCDFLYARHSRGLTITKQPDSHFYYLFDIGAGAYYKYILKYDGILIYIDRDVSYRGNAALVMKFENTAK